MRCTRNGQAGWKFGDEGYCYIGPNAKAKAARQGRAIKASKARRSDALSPESEILKRILADREALGKGKKLRRPPTWRPPISVENRYRRELVGIVNTMEQVVKETVIPHLEGIVSEANQYVQRGDAWPTDLKKLFNDATITIGENTVAGDRLASAIGHATSDYNQTQWRKIVKRVIGVNVTGSEPWLSAELDSFTQENVALITSIKSDSIRDIEGLAQRGVRNGDRHETISKNIRKKFQTTRRRAQLIARDQVSRLNGQLTHLRQTDLGVTHYFWRTSDDERVRPSHRDNDDKRFAWNKPPSTGHPGHDINCRCWAEPDFKSMFGESAETEVPTTSLIESVKVGDESLSTRSLPGTIEMTGPESAASSWVQTSTLNRAWKRYGTGYVKPGGNDLKKRRALVSYLKRQGNGARLDMPVVRLDGDNIEILKGRETFALLRDLGVTQVPVRVSASNVTRFSRTFGLARQGNKLTLGKVKGTTKVAKASAVPKPVKGDNGLRFKP